MSRSDSRFPAGRIIVGIALVGGVQIATAPAADPVLVKQPTCERPTETQFELGGVMADYLRTVTQQWLLIVAGCKSGHAGNVPRS